MAGYVKNLPESWRWRWILPEGSLHHQDDAEWRAFNNVSLDSWPCMDNVLENRFHFDMRAMCRIVDDFQPDIMLCEIPEHVRAMRVVQKKLKLEFPIVAMVEHVDIYEETKVDVSYMMRQMDGAREADLLAFPLEGMREEWFKAAGWMHGEEADFLWRKSRTWRGIFDPHEVFAARSRAERLDEGNGETIFFISRLSDNQRTHFLEFFEATHSLKDTRVWIANPNEALAWDTIKAEVNGYEPHPYGERTLKRSEYLDLLWHADVVPILYPMSHIYSVGYCEAISADNRIVSQYPPNRFTYAGEPCDPKDPADIARACDQALGQAGTSIVDDDFVWLMKDRGIVHNIKTVREDLEALCGSTITS